MMIPIVNRTSKEVLLALEPEGDTVPLAPGQKVVVKAVGGADPQLEIELDDELLTISMMCTKEVWYGDVRLR